MHEFFESNRAPSLFETEGRQIEGTVGEYVSHRRDYLLLVHKDYANIINAHDCECIITDDYGMWGPIVRMTVYPRDAKYDKSQACFDAIDAVFPHDTYILRYTSYPALSVIRSTINARIADMRTKAAKYKP